MKIDEQGLEELKRLMLELNKSQALARKLDGEIGYRTTSLLADKGYLHQDHLICLDCGTIHRNNKPCECQRDK